MGSSPRHTAMKTSRQNIKILWQWELLQRAIRGGLPIPGPEEISERVGANSMWLHHTILSAKKRCRRTIMKP